jgi:hypothetical protein
VRYRSQHARAIDALEAAQAMSPGAQPNDALKKAAFSVEMPTIRG